MSQSSLSAPGWVLTLYPKAGEGGGCFVYSRPPERSYVARGAAEDPRRAADEAARRARAKVRRYCAANRLNWLATPTYGPPRSTDPVEVRGHVGEFFRNTGVNPLVLYTVYGPADHALGAVHATKEAADAAEESGQDQPPVG